MWVLYLLFIFYIKELAKIIWYRPRGKKNHGILLLLLLSLSLYLGKIQGPHSRCSLSCFFFALLYPPHHCLTAWSIHEFAWIHPRFPGPSAPQYSRLHWVVNKNSPSLFSCVDIRRGNQNTEGDTTSPLIHRGAIVYLAIWAWV